MFAGACWGGGKKDDTHTEEKERNVDRTGGPLDVEVGEVLRDRPADAPALFLGCWVCGRVEMM